MILAARPVGAEPTPAPARRRDATWTEITDGPFQSSRLFAMPIADVVGAYQASVSGDGSLLQETGILSFAGVVAVGFGDIAQLEYRHTTAISIEGTSAPVPAVGVQLKLPLRERRWVPAWAVAFRLGVPRREEFGPVEVDETVTDLYLVGRLRLGDRATLHGGARVSKATIAIGGDRMLEADRNLLLPTFGAELVMNPQARLVTEIALAPQFRYDPEAGDDPRIDHGLLGRLGMRWFVHPMLSIDGSVGYQLEVARARAADGLSSIVQWDIRLGGELFIPWGAVVCRATGAFCDEP